MCSDLFVFVFVGKCACACWSGCEILEQFRSTPTLSSVSVSEWWMAPIMQHLRKQTFTNSSSSLSVSLIFSQYIVMTDIFVFSAIYFHFNWSTHTVTLYLNNSIESAEIRDIILFFFSLYKKDLLYIEYCIYIYSNLHLYSMWIVLSL